MARTKANKRGDTNALKGDRNLLWLCSVCKHAWAFEECFPGCACCQAALDEREHGRAYGKPRPHFDNNHEWVGCSACGYTHQMRNNTGPDEHAERERDDLCGPDGYHACEAFLWERVRG